MSHPTTTLKREISKRRRGNPSDTVATFAEVSYESEVENGVEASIAAAKWLDWLSRGSA